MCTLVMSAGTTQPVYLEGIQICASPIRTKVKLQLFDLHVASRTRERFENLREKWEGPLLEHIGTYNSYIALNLRIIGKDRATAIPWVLLECSYGLAKKVRKFFRRTDVKEDFKPKDATSCMPFLPILIHQRLKGQSGLLGLLVDGPEPSSHEGHSTIVYGNQVSKMHTLCGLEIQVCNEIGGKKATMGGLVALTDHKGKLKMYALTAAHFLDHTYDGEEAEEEEDSDGEDDESDSSLDEDELYELDLESVRCDSSSNISIVAPVKEKSWIESLDRKGSDHIDLPGHDTDDFLDRVQAFAGKSESSRATTEIGKIFKVSRDDLQGKPDLDWALVDVIQDFYLPNFAGLQSDMSFHINSIARFRETRSGRNVVLTTTRGSLRGTLSENWSYLALSPAHSMNRMLLLTLSDNKGNPYARLTMLWLINDRTSFPTR